MVFKNGVINIQAAGYNGAHMVHEFFSPVLQMYAHIPISQENIGFEKFNLIQMLL